MSDTPTTAEQVVLRAFSKAAEDDTDPGHYLSDVEAAAIVAALRNSPEALADLNGGGPVASLIVKMAATIANLNTDHEANTVDAVWDACGCDGWDLTSAEVVALRSFVPREATDGSD